MSTHTHLMLALTAIRLRCHGVRDDLQADVIALCDDAQRGLDVDRSPEEAGDASRFDQVRVDGVPGFEAEVRRSPPDHPEPGRKESDKNV